MPYRRAGCRLEGRQDGRHRAIDREFTPYVSVIQTGTRVEFPNRDPIQHHVYSFSPAKTFEIKLYSGRSPESILFDKPGVITIGCNIHDWMIAYVLVVPTPYFAP
jgi:plastocyanin